MLDIGTRNICGLHLHINVDRITTLYKMKIGEIYDAVVRQII